MRSGSVTKWLSDSCKRLECRTTLQKLTPVDLSSIKYYWFTDGEVCGLPARIAHTGYTGEDGFEIYIDPAEAVNVWEQIIAAGGKPCGLGARNTLRLEGKLPLYGHEISDTINVWEAGLDRFCKMEKQEFIGRDALEKAKAAGVKRVLVGLEMTERGIARDGYKVLDTAGREIGYVTSGSPAPYLKKNIALAYVPKELEAVGTPLQVEIRGQGVGAVVVSRRKQLGARSLYVLPNRSQIHPRTRVDSGERQLGSRRHH